MSDQQLRILLLDDELSLREPLKKYLQGQFSYYVDAVANGTEALQYIDAAQGRYDVALIDQTLVPGPDGIKVMKHIKERYPNIECIIFTGWGIEHRQQALEAGAFRYLEKPFDNDELAMLIRTAAQQVRLRAISHAILQELDPAQALLLISGAAQSLSGADDAAIVLHVSPTKRLKIAHPEMPQRWYHHMRDRLLTRKIIETGHSTSFPDIQQLPNIDPEFASSGYRSFVGIPIPGQEGNLGVLYAYSRTPGHFEQWGRIAVLQTLADQAGLAITNAQAHEKVRAHAGFMEALVHAAEGLTRTAEEIDQLALAWNFVREQLRVKTFFVALYDRETDTLRFPVAYDEDQQVNILPCQLGDTPDAWGITGHAVKSGQELIWRTASEKSEQCRMLGITPRAQGKPCLSCFYFPIRSGAEVLGTLSIQEYHEHAFTSSQLDACRALGSQLAVALENARLLASIRRTSERITALNQVVLDIGKEQGQNSLLETVLHHTLSLLEAEGGAVYLLDAAEQRFSLPIKVGLPAGFEDEPTGKDEGIKGLILQTGLAQAVSNYCCWEHRVRSLDYLHLTGVAGAPIRSGTRTLGVVIVHSTQPGKKFLGEDLSLLQQLANHVGLTLQKTALLDRLKSIQQLSSTIASTADFQAVLAGVCKEAVELFGADHSGMVLFEPDLSYGTVRAEYPEGFGSVGLQIPVQNVAAELDVAVQQKSIVLEQLETAQQELGPVYDILHALGIQSIMIVPIVYQDRVLGSFSLDAIEHQRAFTPEEVELCKLFASHAAVAIENARLFEETRQREQLLDALDTASLNIRAYDQIPTMLHQTVRMAAQLMGCEAGCLLLHRPYLGELEIASSDNLPLAEVGLRLPKEEGIAGLIVRTGQPQIVREYASWPERCKVLAESGLRSVAGAPLWIEGAVEAVLIVGSLTSTRDFSSTDIEILQRFASQAALTLHSTRLMTQEQRMLSQMSILRQISDFIQAARDLNQILHMVLTGVTAGYGLGFNRAAVFLREGGDYRITGYMGIGRMNEWEANADWNEHRRRGRDNIRTYMELLEGNALERTPIDERVRDLVVPVDPGSPLGTVIRQGECLRLTDAALQTLPAELKTAFEPASPLVVAPLRARGQVTGILVADNKFTRAPITDDLIEALLTFVNTAAIAIQNTQLLQEVQDERSRLRSFHAASNALTLSHSPIEAVRASVERACEAAQARDVSLILLDPSGKIRDVIYARASRPVADEDLVRPDGLSLSVMRTGQPEKIENADLERARVNPSMFERGIVAALCLPVAAAGERLGVMWFHYGQPHHFSAAEIDAYRFYVNQAALACANARELQALERMRKATEAFAMAENEQEILQQIVQHGCGVMQAKLATVWPYDDTRDLFIPDQFTSCGIEQQWLTEAKGYPPRPGQISETILKNKWKALEDIGSQESLDLLGGTRQALLLKSGTRSLLGEALLAGDEKLGVLYFGFGIPRAFKERELETARSFTHQAALAIKKARLMAEVRRTKDNAAFVAKTSALDELPRVLQAIVTGVQDVLRSNTVTIYAYDFERKEFVFPPAMIGVDDEAAVLMLRHVENQSAVGKIMLLDSPHVAEDAQSDPIFSQGKFVFRENIRSSIGIPLRTRDRKTGVLFIGYRTPHVFSQEELSTIELFANQAAVAIRNAQQYDELNRSKQLMAARTSVAWVGMVGSVWRHTIDKHAITIREASNLIRSELESPVPDLEAVRSWLEITERLANQIMEKPLTPPLTAEEGVSSVCINSFLRERKERMWNSAPYKSCLATLNLELDEDATVRASVEWLRRVLEIVIDNAVSAMASMPEASLTIGSRKVGDFAEIAVTDSGPGIPPAIRDRLFERPIEKPEGSKGLGLGLVLAQMITQTYGGRVRVEDTGPKGTTMIIALPLE